MPPAKLARRLDYVPLDELQPAARNPKRHDLAAIGRSIETFGYVEPVVIDERTDRLVAGHGRLAELRAMFEGGGAASRRCEGRSRRALAGPDVAWVGLRG